MLFWISQTFKLKFYSFEKRFDARTILQQNVLAADFSDSCSNLLNDKVIVLLDSSKATLSYSTRKTFNEFGHEALPRYRNLSIKFELQTIERCAISHAFLEKCRSTS